MIWWLFVLCSVRLFYSQTLLGSGFSENVLHQTCLQYTEWRDLPVIYNGMICGSRNIGASSTALFQATGLYHVMVVSGSHIVFIDRYIKKWGTRSFALRSAGLTLYSYLCLFNPPVLRAVVNFIFSHLAKRGSLYLRDDQIVLGSGLITLILAPQWAHSLSLQLSWVAALCMSLPVSPLPKACLCLAYIAPLLGAQNPLFALNNALFLAVFDVFLFPFTVLTFLIPGTTFASHGVWDLVLPLLEYLPSTSPSPIATADILSGWIFVFALQSIHFWIRK